MNLPTFTEERKIATAKWHEYKAAEKINSNPLYKDLSKVYNQIKSGRKMIDIFKAIQTGGVHENYHPKLAIAQATSKKVYCKYERDGDVTFMNTDRWRGPFASDVILKDCLPQIPVQFLPKTTWGKGYASRFDLEAPVPLIPPKYLPKQLTDDYYILWEVDEWKMIPPTDPWLLRRITKTLFVVLAGWDLTDLEKAVMQARL